MQYMTTNSDHLVGMINEAIVATGIYVRDYHLFRGLKVLTHLRILFFLRLSQYYDSENISESELAFRVCVRPPMYHQQDDYDCMDILYGITR